MCPMCLCVRKKTPCSKKNLRVLCELRVKTKKRRKTSNFSSFQARFSKIKRVKYD
jgi:hypothetical protein